MRSQYRQNNANVTVANAESTVRITKPRLRVSPGELDRISHDFTEPLQEGLVEFVQHVDALRQEAGGIVAFHQVPKLLGCRIRCYRQLCGLDLC